MEAERVRISQVFAGALAAVTAALVGSTMGVAGTVVGAGLASVISTVGGAVYLRSIQRTREGVRTVRAKVVGKSGDETVLVSDEDPSAPEVAAVAAITEVADGTADEKPPAEPRRRLRWPMLVVASLAAFALGMLAVTGVEWLRGEPLSGGTGTTFGRIVDPHRGGGQTEQHAPADPSGPPTTSDSPRTGSSTGSSTSTDPTDPTTTTTTPPPSSGPATTTTTTTPPVTTTTEVAPPGGTVPPSN